MSEDEDSGFEADKVGFVLSVVIGVSALIGWFTDDPEMWIPLGLLAGIIISAVIVLRD